MEYQPHYSFNAGQKDIELSSEKIQRLANIFCTVMRKKH